MQKTKYIISLIVILCCFSCIKEDLDNCPTTRLFFSYLADSDTEVLEQYIASAHLFVYNDKKELVMTKSLSQKELIQKEGVGLVLPQGRYHAVCWGNIRANTEMSQYNSLSSGLITTAGFLSNEKIETSDALYWGEQEIRIESKEAVSDTHLLKFRSAHINLSINVYGVDEAVAITVHNLMPQYNFMMDPMQPYETVYTPEVTFLPEEKGYRSYLHTLRFKTRNPIAIEVKTEAMDVPYRLELSKFLETFYPHVLLEERQEVTIPIVIQFDGLDITATIPEWVGNDGHVQVN